MKLTLRLCVSAVAFKKQLQFHEFVGPVEHIRKRCIFRLVQNIPCGEECRKIDNIELVLFRKGVLCSMRNAFPIPMVALEYE